MTKDRVRPRWLAWAVLVPVIPAPSAGGLPTTLTRVPVVCPICEHAFEAVFVEQSNTGEGVQRDFFARAIGPQPVFYRIATCTRCYYSDYVEDFQRPPRLEAALREKILRRPKLHPQTPISLGMDQRRIPAATRYALAAQVQEWRNAPAESRAWLFLRWAWVVRDEGSFVPPTPYLMLAMHEVESRLPPRKEGENQAERELRAVNLLAADCLEGRFTPPVEPCVRLVVAMLLRRHGENRQARPLLQELARRRDLDEPLIRACERMLASIDEEHRLLQEAATWFERARASGQIRAVNLPASLYLLGELHRRLGDDDSARAWFDKALAQPKTEPGLRDWTVQQRAWAAYRPDERPSP